MSKTMKQISEAQRLAAKKSERAWWFAPETMKFFDSRIETEPYSNPASSLHYFVTSEECTFVDDSPRLYSVRIWNEHTPDQVDTWGSFQQFKTLDGAREVARRLAKNGGAPS